MIFLIYSHILLQKFPLVYAVFQLIVIFIDLRIKTRALHIKIKTIACYYFFLIQSRIKPYFFPWCISFIVGNIIILASFFQRRDIHIQMCISNCFYSFILVFIYFFNFNFIRIV
ncbi:unnamed protein product [Chrysodeixis includens]|uniref:Uncharacterized protein n=1 Tax=Chrysodeixis includens TaxID=689277 RepID=A0A9N8L3Q4_CHRIL|nr:unnamed protein product [Chrysodeixis includens]